MPRGGVAIGPGATAGEPEPPLHAASAAATNSDNAPTREQAREYEPKDTDPRNLAHIPLGAFMMVYTASKARGCAEARSPRLAAILAADGW
jgi:hypothetical protein